MLSFVNRFPCITSTLHPLFRVFNLFTKGRLDYRQPLCFSPNAWWKGFLCVKNQHRKMQIFMFLQRLSLESTMHHCPWSHLNYLGLGYRTTQKAGRRTGMKADRFYYFSARKQKVCSPIATDKWPTNPPLLCPRRQSSKELACTCWSRGNEDNSWMPACVTVLSSLWGPELPLPHLVERNSH